MLLKLIKVQTGSKNKLLTYEQPETSELKRVRNLDISICSLCPYHQTCSILPDPRKPFDDKRSFEDFCQEHDDLLTLTMYPQQGTIEKNLGYIIPDEYE